MTKYAEKYAVLIDLNDINNNQFESFGVSSGKIVVRYNIYDLEKSTFHLYLFEDNESSYITFNALLKKKCINEVIINTRHPINAKPFDRTSYLDLKCNLIKNFISIFEFLKCMLNLKNKIFITFLIHELNKGNFFIQNQFYNCLIIELITNIKNEYKFSKKFFLNCVSTNKINLDYKKKIYPFKNMNTFNEFKYVNYICKLIYNLKLNNKILRL